MGQSGIQRTHLEALFVSGLAGMDGTRINKDHAAGGCKMFGILMGKRLKPPFDHTDHVVFMEMTRIGMPNIGSL